MPVATPGRFVPPAPGRDRKKTSRILSREDVQWRLREEFGDAWIAPRMPAPDLVMGGPCPAVVATPPAVDELCAVVSFCRRLGLAVAPRGNGTHAHVGNPPERADVALSLLGMDRVIRHDAGDMTVAVEAGVTLAALADALSATGQWLPLDPPRPAAVTAGGLIAADLNGGLRFSQGRVRDYLIGLRMVSGAGRIVSGGGRVVKNVAGYDLPKLMVGSFGTLGVIVEAVFKVRPRPAADMTVAAPVGTLAAACERARAVLDAPLAPFAIDVLNAAGAGAAGLRERPHVVVRFGGEHAEVRDELERAANLLPGAAAVDDKTRAALRDFQLDGPGSVACRFSVLPSELPLICERLEAEAAPFGVQPFLQAHAGNGIGRLRLAAGSAPRAQVVPFLRWLRFFVRQRRGALVIEQLPAVLKGEIDVWGQPPAPRELLARVKHALDPERIFNPGRFCGGL